MKALSAGTSREIIYQPFDKGKKNPDILIDAEL